MPELPEVETVVRGLRPRLEGRPVLGLEDCFGGVLVVARGLEPGQLLGQRIRSVERRAKLILLRLEDDLLLTVHLRMTGQLRLHDRSDPVAKHTHVVLGLDRNQELRFIDARRFGRVELHSADTLERTSFWARLGPEPLGISDEQLEASAGGGRAGLKAVLLDQSHIAGIGNIYADEILFAAGLHPAQPANTVLRAEWPRLNRSIQEILSDAIKSGGSTLRDYRRPDGTPGSYQSAHRVFGREGQPCPRCGRAIRKIRVAGRGTHFCPSCQPRRRRKGRPSGARESSQ